MEVQVLQLNQFNYLLKVKNDENIVFSTNCQAGGPPSQEQVIEEFRKNGQKWLIDINSEIIKDNPENNQSLVLYSGENSGII